jgi:hypothetical protein
MGRLYFPGIAMDQFNDSTKKLIEKSIHNDFQHAYIGIKRLPESARFGVYIAYVYYLALSLPPWKFEKLAAYCITKLSA